MTATFGLLHGCTQGPRSWALVAELLADRGVPSVVLDLDPARFTEASGTDCAEHLASELAGHDDVVLVGTSCTGALLPLVAALRPLQALVYVCAAIPDVGRSLDDQVFQDGVLQHDWMHYGDDPLGEEAALRFMFHDCPPERLPEALATVRGLLPQRMYSEPYALPALPDVPSHYVVGADDRIIRPDWARTAARERLGVEPVELPTGHCPQSSRPELLTETLLGFLGR